MRNIIAESHIQVLEKLDADFRHQDRMEVHPMAKDTLPKIIKRNTGTKAHVREYFFRLQRKQVVYSGYDGQCGGFFNGCVEI